MNIVPLVAVPAQTLQIELNQQAVSLRVYALRYGLFMDVSVDDVLVIGGVLCRDRNLIVRDKYRGFSGDFTFVDTAGTADPVYTGLGDRWKLVYLLPDEVPQETPAAVAGVAQ